MVKNLDAYISKDTLNISIENLGELKEILEDIQAKEKDLASSVDRLRIYKLKIKFQDYVLAINDFASDAANL